MSTLIVLAIGAALVAVIGHRFGLRGLTEGAKDLLTPGWRDQA